MRRGSGSEVTESLDSLEILSPTAMGILIILIFMALLSVVESPWMSRSAEETNDLLTIEKKRYHGHLLTEK